MPHGLTSELLLLFLRTFYVIIIKRNENFSVSIGEIWYDS